MGDSTSDFPLSCTVAVVGSGPSGLALAIELKRQGIEHVVVLEREAQAGGVPRHCGHYPFGLREHTRLLTGPDYANTNVAAAINVGVDIRTHASVIAIHQGGQLSITTPAGLQELQAERVVLCTGVRESTRAQRLIGGDRPTGVVSTGALQSLVYLQGMRPFKTPVILGSELVSFSAISTCRHVGIKPVAMVEELERIVTHRVLQPYLALQGVSLHVSASSLKIVGRKQVEALEYIDIKGATQHIECDGVIISGRFRPEASLLQQSHLELDAGTGGPVVDQFGQCSDPAYFSAGNLLRPAESAGWCWQEGKMTAQRIVYDLASQHRPVSAHVKLVSVDPAIRFVLPQRLSLTDRSGGMKSMQIGLQEPVTGYIRAVVDGQQVWRERLQSRPVRRIQKPLSSIIRRHPKTDVTLSIERT